MAYASKAGRAFTNPSNPQAFGVCDRCGIWSNRYQLRNQVDWRGTAILPLNIFVCSECYDTPSPQLRAIALPADPVPVYQPRTEPFLADTTADQTTPYGVPVGLEPYAVSPMGVNPTTGAYQAYGVDLQPLSVTALGTTTITVTCAAAHGLATNDQISVSGLSSPLACGFFSVAVTSATAFTYTTYSAVPAGALLIPHARLVTVIVGLPRGQTTIAQVG